MGVTDTRAASGSSFTMHRFEARHCRDTDYYTRFYEIRPGLAESNDAHKHVVHITKVLNKLTLC